jgi:hypothetical protein
LAASSGGETSSFAPGGAHGRNILRAKLAAGAFLVNVSKRHLAKAQPTSFSRQGSASEGYEHICDFVQLTRRPRWIIFTASRNEDHGSDPAACQEHAIRVQSKPSLFVVSENLPPWSGHLSGQPTAITPNQIAAPAKPDEIEF